MSYTPGNWWEFCHGLQWCVAFTFSIDKNVTWGNSEVCHVSVLKLILGQVGIMLKVVRWLYFCSSSFFQMSIIFKVYVSKSTKWFSLRRYSEDRPGYLVLFGKIPCSIWKSPICNFCIFQDESERRFSDKDHKILTMLFVQTLQEEWEVSLTE